jgi:molybdenum cofactor biosynthesis enzyme MoaA
MVIDKKRPQPKAPRAIQIQTISGCNGNCVFCPNKKTRIDIPYKKSMDKDLFRSIIDQCVTLNVRRISPYLMNEPLMDPDLPERIDYISRKKKRRQYTKINSNGSLLTEKTAHELMDAGLDRLHISVQGIDPDVYNNLMKLQFDQVVKNIEQAVQIKESKKHATEIRVVMLDTMEIHPHLDTIRAFWRERGVSINVNQMENRGTHNNIDTGKISANKLSRFRWCDRLFRQAYVLYDGRMVQCCADWEQTKILGDLSQDSLKTVWNGPEYMKYRQKFIDWDLKGSICNTCMKDAGTKE